MAFRITSSNVGVGSQPIADISSTQNHALGTIVVGEDPTYGVGEFIYLKGVASTAVGSWVTYGMDDGQTALAAANAKGPVAVAMAACTSGAYGWYQITGKAQAFVASSCADNANVFLTASAGVVDDASVAGDLVTGAFCAGANAAASAAVVDVELNRPQVHDLAAY